MLNQVRDAVSGVDRLVRLQALKRAQDMRRSQVTRTRSDLLGRATNDPEGTARAVGSLLGASDDQLAVYADQLRDVDQRDALIRQAARAEKPGLLYQVNRVMAGDDAMSRLGQAGIYGAVGGGGVLGGVGLTAAGQELIALMQYMQQGQQTDASRDEAPVV